MSVIYGTSAGDTIYGTSGADISIFGREGDDLIYGLGGNDIIDAGADDDEVYGGSGNDTILGRDGDDDLNGDSGVDSIWGEAGNDDLSGGADNDYLFGGLGDDRLLGVASRNAVEIDELTGGGGRDTFYVGDYHGNFYNNAGNDDYALIKDFSSLDKIVLDRGSYTTGSSPVAGVSGTAIYQGNELLAIVQGMGGGQRLRFDDTGYTTTATVQYMFQPDLMIKTPQYNLGEFNFL
ncbi:MAG: calcium-binding protein [Cyanobacteria bacterium J06623_4]